MLRKFHHINKLKKQYNYWFALLLVLVVSILGTIYLTLHFENKLHAYNYNRYESFLLADRLRHSSDDLTRMVRTYVATSNAMYRDQFYKVLDIRNGIIPRPQNYHRVYWDLIADSLDRPPFRNLEQPVSLEDLMHEAGFVEHEFALLQESELQSNMLVKLEEEAINALHGLYKDEAGKYTLEDTPSRMKAIEILHNQEFHDIKKRIMAPINEFLESVESRTELQVTTQNQKLNRVQIILLIQFLLISLVIFNMFRINRKMNRAIVDDLEEQIELKTIELSERNKMLNIKNKQLEEFVYIASHDLQEPVNTISGFSDLLMNNNKGKLDELGLKSMEVIQQSAGRMKEFIIDLLEFSRIGRTKTVAEVNMNELMEVIKVDLAANIQETNTQITYDNLPTISCFNNDILRLFENLIGNSIKYRKEEVTPEIHISYEELNDGHKFSISDNGIGIPTENGDKIFDLFRRLHGRHKYKGTGIGLSICKKIVEMHDGEIWFESTEGTGSTFYLTISKYLNDGKRTETNLAD